MPNVKVWYLQQFQRQIIITHVNTNFSGLTHGKYSNNYRQKLECQVIYT